MRGIWPRRTFLGYKDFEEGAEEGVFDRPTLMVLQELINSNHIRYLKGVVRTGKEARVYWGVRDDGSSAAVKIYLVATAQFKRRLKYIIGDPRFQRVKKGTSNLIELWARKEYRNLMAAQKAGIPVPRPFAVKRNVLVMEFVGRDGISASLLSEAGVLSEDYRKVVSMIMRLYRRARLVHSDLSEYNVFKLGRRLLLFDFASAVELGHPLAKQFLMRDIENINRFFERQGVQVLPSEQVLGMVMGTEL